MHFERSVTVGADTMRAWQFLQDAEKVAGCVPDLDVQPQQDGAAVTLRVAFDGPPLTYTGRASCTQRDEAALRLAVEGRGVARFTGSANLTAALSLAPLIDATRLDLVGEVELTGKPTRLDPDVVHAALAAVLDRTVEALVEALGDPATTTAAEPAEQSLPARPPLAQEEAVGPAVRATGNLAPAITPAAAGRSGAQRLLPAAVASVVALLVLRRLRRRRRDRSR